MQRYFITSIDNKKVSFSKEDSHHIKDVMRMNIGQKIELVSKSQLYLGEITCLLPVEARIISEELVSSVKKPSITLAQSLVQMQKMEFILQKSTELGVDKIIPLLANRAVVKIEAKEDKKIARWQTILKEASEQSKRLTIPEISKCMTIQELSKLDYDLKILCTVNEVSKRLNSVLQNINNHAKILIVIGPEGGFTPLEEEILIKEGFISTSLGELVLRTETVALYVMSVIEYLFLR
ncbi:MAG: RsmE family RNA methyltransferase [Bacilli bacterium]